MGDFLQTAMRVAGSGMDAQSVRLRVISENIANAQSVGGFMGADPYARKTVSFESEVDRASGAPLVHVRTIGTDDSPFRTVRDPSSPAADLNGIVKMPNVDVLVELADMREANRSYEANLQVAKQSASLMGMTVALLKDA
jgi:flagellar basal-body rod protein FlgC